MPKEEVRLQLFRESCNMQDLPAKKDISKIIETLEDVNCVSSQEKSLHLEAEKRVKLSQKIENPSSVQSFRMSVSFSGKGIMEKDE
jgi:UDP-N-acetylglucosamine enolpyruvyl transferase